MPFDLNSAKPSSGFDLSTANIQPESAEDVGARYESQFKRKPGAVESGVMGALGQLYALGKGAMTLPLLATEGLYAAAGSEQSPMAEANRISDVYAAYGGSPLVTAATESAGGALGLTGAAGTLVNSQRPLVAGLAKQVASRPGLGVASGLLAGSASHGAKEAGFGPYTQAGAGFAAGLLPGLVGAAGSSLARAATESKAPQILAQRLAASGLTPAQAAESLGPSQTIAELGKPMSDLAGAVVRRSPSAASAAERLAATRKDMRSSQLLQRIESEIGGTRNTALQTDDILTQLSRDSAPLYEAAYRSAPKITISKDIGERSSVKNGYEVMRKMLAERGYGLPDINPRAVQPIPPLRLEHADMLKRAMDDVIYVSKMPTSGIGKSQLKDMTDTRNALVREIDEQAGPEYAAARKAFAGPAEARDALEFGSNYSTMSPEQIARYIADPAVSEAERNAFRIGVASRMKEKIGSISDTREPAALFSSPNARQVMQVTDRQGPSYLPELIRSQRAQSTFEQGLLGGSQTQPRAAADELLSGAMSDMPTKDAILASLLRRGTDRFVTGNQATLNDLERTLLGTNQEANRSALARLSAPQQAQRLPFALQSYLSSMTPIPNVLFRKEGNR